MEDLYLSNTFSYADDITYQSIVQKESYRDEVLPQRLDKVIKDEFPGVTSYLLPVLFDYADDFLNPNASAIVPAAVNFQTLGKHLLVPRPYGARMRVADAVPYMNELLKKTHYPKMEINERFIRTRGLDKTWHWTRSSERVSRANMANMPTEFDADYAEYKDAKRAAMYYELPSRALDIISNFSMPNWYTVRHADDPLSNHPISEFETLYRIASYFKDGFDAFKNYPVDFCEGDTEKAHPKWDIYEKSIKDVMNSIDKANPGVFDKQGNITSKDWVRISIPEDTVDVFELYTQILMESLGLSVHWVDSWYYHIHFGGIHCGTNVLRTPNY
jgi:Protein-arginine deiminase (PAD)